MFKNIKNISLITAIAALSAFYLYTLYLAANPQVSLSYRLFYLEGKTKFWEFNSDMVYRPGSEIDLTKMSRFLSREGWEGKPTAQGTEMIAPGGVYFVLEKPQPGLTATFKVHGDQVGTKFKVSIGKNWSQTLTLEQAGLNTLSLSLPGTHLVSGANQLNFIAIEATNPIRMQSLRFDAIH